MLVFLLYFLIASTFTLSKALVTNFYLLSLLVFRFLIGGFLLLIGTLILYSPKVFKIQKEDWSCFFQIIFALYCFGFMLDNYAIFYIDSSISSLIYNLSPFFTAGLSYILFKRKLNTSELIGLCIGFSSLSVLFFNDFHLSSFIKISSNKLLFFGAYSSLIIAVISNAYGWIIFDQLLKRGYMSSVIHCVGLLGAGCVGLFLMGLSKILNFSELFFVPTHPVTILGSAFFDLIALIFISHIICAILYGQLLKKFSPTFISFAGCITPLIVAFFGFIFLNEKITWHFFIATGGVTLGLLLFYKNEKPKGIHLK